MVIISSLNGRRRTIDARDYALGLPMAFALDSPSVDCMIFTYLFVDGHSHGRIFIITEGEFRQITQVFSIF